jgi:hypothetical protein
VPSYRALVGLSFPPDRRVEAGEVADDIPPQSAKWLHASGHIEPVEGKRPPATRDEEG